MTNLCTLFNSNYLGRGLALYESLLATSQQFHLYVVAFDKAALDFLQELSLANMTTISLTEFEDDELLQIKPTRTAAEYCWTCTSSLILYCLNRYNLDSCTYVDADMYFFDDPEKLIIEAGDNSVIITEHRYSPEYDVSRTHGIYCVQFMFFRADKNGFKVLNWWRDRCIEWCYNRQEDGKFGDQKYLDDWPQRFEGVHVLKNLGAGVAPWNIQQYQFIEADGRIHARHMSETQSVPLVFFHYHGLKFYANRTAACSGPLYHISKKQKKVIYYPYIALLARCEEQYQSLGSSINMNGAAGIPPSARQLFIAMVKEHIILTLKGNFQALKLRSFNFRNHKHLVNITTIITHSWPTS